MLNSSAAPYEAAYEAYFEKSSENSNMEYYQTTLQCLGKKKGEARQKVALAANSARIGRTMDEQRNFFYQKSRPFALEPNKAQETLPVDIGALTLKQLVLQRHQAQLSAILIVATTPVALSLVVAPVAFMPPEFPEAPASLTPFLESGCGLMFEVFTDHKDFKIFRQMFALSSVRIIHDIFAEEEAVFGDIFAVPKGFGALTVSYIPASPNAAVSSPITSRSAVVKKLPLSKLASTVREMKLRIPSMAMGAMIEIYKEMEADGRITYPAPISKPVVATPVASIATPVIPDIGSDGETSSASGKGSSDGSPISVSSISDAEEFLSKIELTPFPTPTKAKKFTSKQNPAKTKSLKAVESRRFTSPLLAFEEKSRSDSPTNPSSTKNLAGWGNAFTPTLISIESSPAASPSRLPATSPPASPFARPGNPTPTRAARVLQDFVPVLSPIQDGEAEKEEIPVAPIPMHLDSILSSTTTFAKKTEPALDSIIPTFQMTDTGVIDVVPSTEFPVLDTPVSSMEEPKAALQKLKKSVDNLSTKLPNTKTTTEEPSIEEPSINEEIPSIIEQEPDNNPLNKETLESSMKEFKKNLLQLKHALDNRSTTLTATYIPAAQEPSIETGKGVECPVTTRGWMVTNVCAYYVAQSMRMAPTSMAVVLGIAVVGAYRFFGRES